MMTTTSTTTKPSGYGALKMAETVSESWLRGQDLNLRPSGYEPPDSSPPALRKSKLTAKTLPLFAELGVILRVTANTVTTTWAVFALCGAANAASLNATASVEIVKSSSVQFLHNGQLVQSDQLLSDPYKLVPDPDNSYQVVEQPWGVEVVYE